MALLPEPKAKMAVGAIGQWANMEECNSFTATAQSSFGFGIPLAKGNANGADLNVVPLTTGNQFVGISLSNVYTTGAPNADGQEQYGVGDILGVADEGVIFVEAGAGVVKGAKPFYEVATGRYHGTSAAGRLPIPGARFDGAAAAGDPVALKFRVDPGAANVTAAT